MEDHRADHSALQDNATQAHASSPWPEGEQRPEMAEGEGGQALEYHPEQQSEQHIASSSRQSFDDEVRKIRQPLYSQEAEQSLLGAVMLDNQVLDNVADVLSPDDFYLAANQVIFRAMLDLHSNQQVIDPIVLRTRLEKDEELDMVGGPGYLLSLLDAVPTTANAKAYSQLIHDRSVLRSLAREATEVVEMTRDPRRTLDDVIDEAERRIFAVAEQKSQRRSEYFLLKDVVGPIFRELYEKMENPTREDVTGVPSGFHEFDKLTAGFQKSDLLILA
ncbi:DnaB-like helicase N-terminal domain-containing protein, partial [Magnetococcales bacterium HHB-1]